MHVSAAIGITLYNPAADHDVDDVLKRADQEMYEMKKEMKAIRTDTDVPGSVETG